MNTLRTLAQEVAGLFVDDKWYAAAIGAWLLVNFAMSAFVQLDPTMRAIFLALGLIVILIGSVVRAGLH